MFPSPYIIFTQTHPTHGRGNSPRRRAGSREGPAYQLFGDESISHTQYAEAVIKTVVIATYNITVVEYIQGGTS